MNAKLNQLLSVIFISSLAVFSSPSTATSSSDLKRSEGIWDALLQKNIRPSGAVDYAGFEKSIESLNKFISGYEEMNFQNASDSVKTAAYINLYNALMISNILKHAKDQKIAVSSSQFTNLKINDIKIPGGNIWGGDYKAKIGNILVNLDNIEHDLIRGKAKGDLATIKVKSLDPRIHAAVNCAAISCPPVRLTAYTASNLDKMLTENMDSWLNNEKQFYKSGNQLKANNIIKWYYSDFDNHAQERLKTKGAGVYLAGFVSSKRSDSQWITGILKKNFNDRSAIALKMSSDFSFFYNWQINDIRNYGIKN